jgi:flavin-dependent dehydrogenase
VDHSTSETFDVVVVGGAFAGASTALLLKRRLPEARIALVEAAARFDRKVGEATVEVSSYFMTRVLGIEDVLDAEHVPKHGLRYWFEGSTEDAHADLTEVGPATPPEVPSYQLDRARIDESIHARAREAGVHVLRPVRVRALELGEAAPARADHRVVVEEDGVERALRTRWIVDASGRRALLARKLGILERNRRHPTNAWWARWKNVRDQDDDGLGHGGERLPPLEVDRRKATNHYCGYGLWCWTIPLAGGDTSIGLVWDQRMFTPERVGTPRENYEHFVRTRAGLRELVGDAEIDGDDFRSYHALAYRSSAWAGRGWALVGDAAAFLDPWYSPGLDHVSFSAAATAKLVGDHLEGELADADLAARVAAHNGEFDRFYERAFEGLYEDKYALMGDAELCGAAFLLDTALYYLGVVRPVYRDPEEIEHPMLGRDLPQAHWAGRTLRFYNRRLVRLAHLRRRKGAYGRHNNGRRVLIRTPRLKGSLGGMLVKGVALWLRAETHGILLRLRRDVPGAAELVPAAPPGPSGPARTTPATECAALETADR